MPTNIVGFTDLYIIYDISWAWYAGDWGGNKKVRETDQAWLWLLSHMWRNSFFPAMDILSLPIEIIQLIGKVRF